MTDYDIGGRLRRAREQRGLSLTDAARRTKLSTGVLQAIERNDFASLPAGMYRKAYLRTLAVEVGVDQKEVAADYDALFEPVVTPTAASDLAVPRRDELIEQLASSPRRGIVSLTVAATLSMVWFALQPNPSAPGSTADHSRDEPPAKRASLDAQATVSAPDARTVAAHVVTTTAPPAGPLKIDLTTTGWCWVAAESDGERVMFGLIEPGRRVVVEAERRISLRLGNAGSVQLSINDGPSRTPGAHGEVVELEVTPDALSTLQEGPFESESELLAR